MGVGEGGGSVAVGDGAGTVGDASEGPGVAVVDSGARVGSTAATVGAGLMFSGAQPTRGRQRQARKSIWSLLIGRLGTFASLGTPPRRSDDRYLCGQAQSAAPTAVTLRSIGQAVGENASSGVPSASRESSLQHRADASGPSCCASRRFLLQ